MASVRLSHELAELLLVVADAYAHKDHVGSKQAILFYSALGMPSQLQHEGLPDGAQPVDVGDLHELNDLGLIDISFGRSEYDGQFRVTGLGYAAVEKIREQHEALATASVVPVEGAAMGMDWETQTFPVLKAVYDRWTKDPTPKGVSQQQINAELGRSENDPVTAVVLRKLEKAEFISGKFHAEQVEGPLFCEPTPKALEFLAGWPSDRADAALSRFISAIEAEMEATTDPEMRGKLKRLLGGVKDVGQGVMVKVLTNIITEGV